MGLTLVNEAPRAPLSVTRPVLAGTVLPSEIDCVRALNVRGEPGISLAEFVSAAWHVIEPETPLVWNWHINVLCDHIQGQLVGAFHRSKGNFSDKWAQDLILNVPPGTMKSLILNVFAVAWVWLWRPGWRVICASGNPRISMRDSIRCRDLLESQWYRETFNVSW